MGQWFQENDYGSPELQSSVALSVITVKLTFTDDSGGTGTLTVKLTLS